MSSQLEYRKVQEVASATFVVSIPKQYLTALGIGKGDYVKITARPDKIIIEKAEA